MQKLQTMTELAALLNAADPLGLTVVEYQQHDNRKTVKKYYLSLHGVSVSPVLDYEQLNYFLLGMHRGKEIFTKP